MRTLMTALLMLALALPASAKDLPWTSAWSRLWVEDNGQHRCAVQVDDTSRPARITLLCQLGPDAVYAESVPIPAFGDPITVTATAGDFGAPPNGHIVWGTIRWHAVCRAGAPEINGTAYTLGAVSDLRLKPLVPFAVKLCDGGAR